MRMSYEDENAMKIYVAKIVGKHGKRICISNAHYQSIRMSC